MGLATADVNPDSDQYFDYEYYFKLPFQGAAGVALDSLESRGFCSGAVNFRILPPQPKFPTILRLPFEKVVLRLEIATSKPSLGDDVRGNEFNRGKTVCSRENGDC
jgi:hypothetical protein